MILGYLRNLIKDKKWIEIILLFLVICIWLYALSGILNYTEKRTKESFDYSGFEDFKSYAMAPLPVVKKDIKDSKLSEYEHSFTFGQGGEHTNIVKYYAVVIDGEINNDEVVSPVKAFITDDTLTNPILEYKFLSRELEYVGISGKKFYINSGYHDPVIKTPKKYIVEGVFKYKIGTDETRK